MKLQQIIAAVQEYYPSADLEPIRKAFNYVRQCHDGQMRASGEPYITHVAEVAFLACRLKLDISSIVAALLHDTVEDTNITIDDIKKEFNEDVAHLVGGVTKLNRVNFSSRAEQQAENFRKMLLAMARDIRVLLLKLCDRTHNMRTLEFLSEPRQMRIAQETLDIYAPLAHRLGIYWMKSELEDLSFRYLKPTIYTGIKEKINQKKRERERYIEDVVALISRELSENNIKGSVFGRPKTFYSIYHKMETQALNFDDLYDLIAFRIIVDSTMDCYAALGVVHAAWKPIPGRFKDYIAMPKPNGYQSLHTAVIGPKAARIEIQIRNQQMHDIAEKGIAAHWIYKETSKTGKAKTIPASIEFAWLKDLLESERLLRDPHEFMSLIKDGLFPQEVYVFSPKGDLLALPINATAIDFAFQVHSEVGMHCTGARVNGQQVPLSHKLQNGDTVEINTSPNRTPSKDWLRMVVSSKAKQRIRNWLKAEERAKSVLVGKELLAKDLRKLKLNLPKLIKDGELEEAAKELGYKDLDLLLAEIGYGKITSTAVVEKLLPEEEDLEAKLADDSVLQRHLPRSAEHGDHTGVQVNGMEGLVFKFAKCCEPLPGDDILGFVTRGRGVTIHKRGCTQAMSFDYRRLIDVHWDPNAKAERTIHINVITIDKVGMLAALSQCIAAHGVHIVAAQAAAIQNGKALHRFDISVENKAQASTIVRALEKLDGVIQVERNRNLAPSDFE
ncbi:MAG: bifunctional (p)ppGpp synthetase/guanosine-3',5'-bis(diphosphate) 3'-pyrophosphohydrolase [Deltaproteobacteria bacterium]|nr:bifunctional (p)ppGpp synthetase/guanosine-3',5'-bis(diphosphate) 3'-pyrophosphohydrolase [Deltaproteobacteria bacterium]